MKPSTFSHKPSVATQLGSPALCHALSTCATLPMFRTWRNTNCGDITNQAMLNLQLEQDRYSTSEEKYYCKWGSSHIIDTPLCFICCIATFDYHGVIPWCPSLQRGTHIQLTTRPCDAVLQGHVLPLLLSEYWTSNWHDNRISSRLIFGPKKQLL